MSLALVALAAAVLLWPPPGARRVARVRALAGPSPTAPAPAPAPAPAAPAPAPAPPPSGELPPHFANGPVDAPQWRPAPKRHPSINCGLRSIPANLGP